MTEKRTEQLHAIVQGRVQGVGFRDATYRRAVDLGLSGWVRNRPDNTVEVTAEGDRAALDQLLAFLQRGPSAARVISVDADWLAATNGFRDFSIR